jgi:hypothetical protein
MTAGQRGGMGLDPGPLGGPWWVGTMGGGYISEDMVWVYGYIYLHKSAQRYILVVDG